MLSRVQGLPRHLRKYVVDQNYEKYTFEDQATWRFILRQLKDYLSMHAHPYYSEGLRKTGISIDTIPHISEMNKKLSEFGWGAVPVSGFIPPAAFMEFQSLGILPIASDMRSIDHLTYTPAPDIVHEAAGHAPLLIHPDYAQYLKNYATIAKNAIIGKLDLEQYSAIRELSDVKENPSSTPEKVQEVESRLNEINKKLKTVSEAGWLSRMNWWTAEYGLIGSIDKPQIFGAGLLSSVGESRQCLSEKVQKIPLSIRCIETSYDITEPQPQLFVTPDFETLNLVLEQLGDRMAFRAGDKVGIQRAIEAETVNSIELDSGIQASGKLIDYKVQENLISFVKFEGHVALAKEGCQLDGHGTDFHKSGFSSPIGFWKGISKEPQHLSDSELHRLGLALNQRSKLTFASGLTVEGEPISFLREAGRLLIVSWKNCRVKMGSEILFEPSWGQFDMLVGSKIVKVFGGAADREQFGQVDDFVSARVPQRSWSENQKKKHQLYWSIRELRNSPEKQSLENWQELATQYLQSYRSEWLIGVELIESSLKLNAASSLPLAEKIHRQLDECKKTSENVRGCIEDGLRIAGLVL